MKTLLDEYLSRGFSGIFVIENEQSESGDWYGTERLTQTVVAKSGAGFVRATGIENHTFGPKGQHIAEITDTTAITQAEYESAAQGHELDSPAARQEFQDRRAGFAQAEKVKQEIEAKAPECPVHGKTMRLVSGPKVYFFGCPKHPKCSQKAWLSSTQQALAKTAPYLATVLD